MILSTNIIEDIKLKAFTGAGYSLSNICMVYPLTVKDIVVIGENNYQRYLSLLTMTSDELYDYYKQKKIKVPENIDVFKNLMESCEYDDTFLIELEKAFSTFIREQVQILPDSQTIIIGELDKGKFIRKFKKEDFYEFQQILRIQNKISLPEEIPENETPMQKKFRLRRLEVKKAKRKQNQKKQTEATSFLNLISSMMCYLGLPLAEILKLPLFAFYDLLGRNQNREKYDYDVRAILAGADAKKIKLVHWTDNTKEE